MTDQEQAREYLRQYLVCRKTAPWIAYHWLETCDPWQHPQKCIERLGGMAGNWECHPYGTYYGRFHPHEHNA